MAYTAIDIGPGAADYGSYAGRYTTFVDVDNSANATGLLNSFEVWINTRTGSSQVAYWGTFYGSSTSYTSRSSSSNLGSITTGSKQTFTGQNISTSAGDFIGFFADSTIEYSLEMNTTGGSAVYYKTGNMFGAGVQTYTIASGYKVALYATGIAIPDAPTSVSATDNLSTKITITWTAGTGETDGHRVYRDTVDVSGIVAHGTNTYDDVPSAGTYSYTVKAINTAGLSAASTADNGTRISSGIVPHIVVGDSLKNVTLTSVKISNNWKSITNGMIKVNGSWRQMV